MEKKRFFSTGKKYHTGYNNDDDNNNIIGQTQHNILYIILYTYQYYVRTVALYRQTFIDI